MAAQIFWLYLPSLFVHHNEPTFPKML
ncbi:uncharacterized protein METZ01_LOCUS330502, partial [marine metagenome]